MYQLQCKCLKQVTFLKEYSALYVNLNQHLSGLKFFSADCRESLDFRSVFSNVAEQCLTQSIEPYSYQQECYPSLVTVS